MHVCLRGIIRAACPCCFFLFFLSLNSSCSSDNTLAWSATSFVSLHSDLIFFEGHVIDHDNPAMCCLFAVVIFCLCSLILFVFCPRVINIPINQLHLINHHPINILGQILKKIVHCASEQV